MASQKSLVKFPEIFFKGPLAKQRHQSFVSKKCVTARRVDTASLESENLSCIRDLRNLHWDLVLELDDLVFESYTKLFYANLNAKRESDSLKIYLKGREVKVSVSLLNQILGVPDEGEWVTPKKGDLGIEEYNSVRWIGLISGGKSKTALKGDMFTRNKKTHHECCLVFVSILSRQQDNKIKKPETSNKEEEAG